MPILPYYAKEYGANATQLGLIFTAYAAAQFAAAPLWGRLSDRIGRRNVMLVTVAGTALSLLLLGLAESLPWIFAARLLAGGFAANVSVASAYISDVTDEAERTRWMGLLGASFGVGFVLGPAIGGLLAPWGHHVPMLVAAGLATLNWLHAAVSLREPARHTGAPAAEGRAGALREPAVRRLCVANFAYSAAVTQLETVFAYFMLDRFGWDAPKFAFLLVGMAVLMGGIQGGGMKALAARFHERALVIAGAAMLAAAFVLVPEAPGVAILIAVLALAAVGRAIAQPSLMSLTSMAAAARSRGSVMGAFQASASLARIVGPLAGGWLYDRAPGAPFWLAAALATAVALGGRALPDRAADAPAPPTGAPV
jgi:MFS family permease